MDIQSRSAWFRSWVACAIMGTIGYQLWGGDRHDHVGSIVLWLLCARCAWVGLDRFAFAAELRSLRKRAAQKLEPFNEKRFELIISARRPDVPAIISEQKKLNEELKRSAARRRLTLLEAGVDLPDRWRDGG